MHMRRVLFVGLVLALGAGSAVADTKIVQKTHTDGFTIMGQQQAPKDEQMVMWLGSDRLRTDTAGQSFIVRSDLKKMWMVDHDAKKYYELDLPVDMSQLMPAGMGEQMMQMMKLDATVKPTGEAKTIGEWTAQGYDVAVTSAMMQMKLKVWASRDVRLDFARFNSLYEQTKLISPGMDAMVAEMRKIDGFQVASEGTMTMMGANVKTSEELVSIEEGSAPAGHYDPPAGYAKQAFDFMAMQQMKK